MTMEIYWLSQSENDLPRAKNWLTDAERERASSMRYTKRRVDYLLGRWTAKCAVARTIGLPAEASCLSAVEIRNIQSGPQRGAPEAFVRGVPAELSISITDRAGWGICAVHQGSAAIGCDLELVEPRSDAFVEDYLTVNEQELVARTASTEDRYQLANLIWCAKESALKVLRSGLRRDTRSVEVSLGEEQATEGWSSFSVTSDEGKRFFGWWQRYRDFLLTFSAEEEISPPIPMVNPPSLRCALPKESWLEAPLSSNLS